MQWLGIMRFNQEKVGSGNLSIPPVLVRAVVP